MRRLIFAALFVVTCSACDSEHFTSGPTDADLVDLDGDGFDDRDMQFLLDLLANNPERDLEPTEIGEQEWEGGRLVSLNTWASSGDTRVTELEGPLPGSIGFLTEVRVLSVVEQNFRGPIPATVGNLRNVEALYLFGNGLSGEIPSTLSKLSTLRFLNLASNQLSGEIPASVAALPLSTFSASFNRLSGPVPRFDMDHLSSLVLTGNELTGEPLAQIVEAPHLKLLYLAGNDFEGSFPPALVDASPWTIDIDLAGNRFRGVIPAEVCGRFNWDGRQRGYSRLDGNAFCPPWPSCLEPWQIGAQSCDELQ